MKAYTEYLVFNTNNRIEYINITDRVQNIIDKSKIKEGFVLVSAMHTTAAVFVNDDESGLKKDMNELLEKIIPNHKHPYRHNLTGEDNAYAHLRRWLIGHQVTLPITNGKLDLGPWEQVFYLELDGRRNKRVIVKILGE